MKSYLSAVILLLAAATMAAQETVPTLIPAPVEWVAGKGTFTLQASTTIGYNQPEARATAQQLAARLLAPTGFSLPVSATRSADIQFQILERTEATLGSEGYTLEVGPKKVVISANRPAGLFYGMQSFLQLFPTAVESPTRIQTVWSVPAVRIKDYPRFSWRGMMLDVSRHFFPKEEVMAFIDQMARYKYNTFHWHLTDDNGWRIEIKSLPKLTSVGAWRVDRAGHFGDRAAPRPGEPTPYGGFYTQEDIREVIRFAAERHVTVVPEIDVPGHSMAALAAYPELSCTGDTSIRVNPGTRFSEWYGNGTFRMLVDNTLNPSDERVYAFLDKVFTEVADLFPNPYIHVGGDECYKGFWNADPGCQALMKEINTRHVEDLQGYFMGRLEEILRTKGKRLLGWDEILEGGISPDATVMSWRGISGGIEAAQLGHDVVMTPTSFTYIDFNQGDQTVDPPIYAGLRITTAYSFDPVPTGVDPKFILGGQANLWTEQIPSLRHAEYMTWPRGWALSEVYWSPKDKKEWNAFVPRMEAHFDRFEQAGINFSRAVYDPIVRTRWSETEGLVLEMASEVPGVEIRYTIDDTMPDQRSPRYSEPVPLPDGPVTLRVQAHRDGIPIGHLITLDQKTLQRRAGR
ncbi:MAG: hypothetical protein RLY31_1997 [Bacteroidota bacterium]